MGGLIPTRLWVDRSPWPNPKKTATRLGSWYEPARKGGPGPPGETRSPYPISRGATAALATRLPPVSDRGGQHAVLPRLPGPSHFRPTTLRQTPVRTRGSCHPYFSLESSFLGGKDRARPLSELSIGSSGHGVLSRGSCFSYPFDNGPGRSSVTIPATAGPLDSRPLPFPNYATSLAHAPVAQQCTYESMLGGQKAQRSSGSSWPPLPG